MLYTSDVRWSGWYFNLRVQLFCVDFSTLSVEKNCQQQRGDVSCSPFDKTERILLLLNFASGMGRTFKTRFTPIHSTTRIVHDNNLLSTMQKSPPAYWSHWSLVWPTEPRERHWKPRSTIFHYDSQQGIFTWDKEILQCNLFSSLSYQPTLNPRGPIS